jgi:peroxiredoxin
MAAIPSTMLALGTAAPAFALPEVTTGATIQAADFAGHPLLVMFICHHCPFVKHVKAELSALGRDFASTPLAIVAISSNDPAVSADDSPEGLRTMAANWQLNYPVCYDESQAVAHAYQAACTPDFFLFDAAHALVYRGQLDGSRPSNGKPVTGHDLRAAIAAVLSGAPVDANQMPSLGCNIKWRPGNTPNY